MRYADPSANRDLLGNRTLLFIFICAFALVTLLQQILYGRNYIKRSLQFGWQSGDQLANWTGLFNVTDDPAVQSGSDSSSRYFEFYEGPFEYNSTRCLELRHEILEVKVLSMVKQSELFDRWKSLQMCRWAMNISEANQFKGFALPCVTCPSCCVSCLAGPLCPGAATPPPSYSRRRRTRPWGRSSSMKWTPAASTTSTRRSSACFPRCNLPPISEKYTMDVGVKTDVVTVNPSIITERFHKLEKWRRPFYRVLQVYENASVLLPAFYNTRNTDVSIRVKYVLDDFESTQAVYYFHPQYLVNVSRYWLSLGVRAKRISTGLILATAALELCEEVHLFGFWAFPMNPSGLYITHHYYDNVKPRPGFHAMPSEIFNFLHLHSRGILRVHTGTCTCC
ncbi:alpha-2,8-sialyltransferase 8E isoform X2 [Herpailurus yagouaroundi]|uniref:alpha-2,8-sialyltransferase 8E isoform X2 n=1 Tax=Herpailurus yagouaroundi TaxID=1608482 RepID=UPI001AD6F114|nr:alpha-2,8-sialyltransferase 8E isoform X2 [Puma yagouaroundi]